MDNISNSNINNISSQPTEILPLPNKELDTPKTQVKIKKTKYIKYLIIIFLVILICFLAFIFIKNKKSQNNTVNTNLQPTPTSILSTPTLTPNPTFTPTPTPKPTSILTPTLTPTPTDPNKITKIGKHIDIVLDPDDVVKISDEKLTLWLSRLDSAYEYYSELTGYSPYSGGKITIKSVPCGDNCPGWAWAGQTISWAKKWWLIDELEKVNNNDDWSFGILHEISHNFDFDNSGVYLGYNFDTELMANFKMAYLVEQKNSKVSPGYSGVYYIGPKIIDYYKSAERGYDYAITNNSYTGDFLTYVLLRIKDQIGGWDTYKQVFRNLKDKKFDNQNAVFGEFINEINFISKKDLKTIFSDSEKKILNSHFGNIFN